MTKVNFARILWSNFHKNSPRNNITKLFSLGYWETLVRENFMLLQSRMALSKFAIGFQFTIIYTCDSWGYFWNAQIYRIPHAQTCCNLSHCNIQSFIKRFGNYQFRFALIEFLNSVSGINGNFSSKYSLSAVKAWILIVSLAWWSEVQSTWDDAGDWMEAGVPDAERRSSGYSGGFCRRTSTRNGERTFSTLTKRYHTM